MIKTLHSMRYAPVTVLLAAMLLTGCGSEPGKSQTADTVPIAKATKAVEITEPMLEVTTTELDLLNPDCLSYGMMRTGLTSDGPDYPLPVFSPAIERRCVIAFRDNRADIITILAEGDIPQPSSNPRNTEPVFGSIPNAGGLRGSIDGPEPGVISIRATTALGGQANADAMLKTNWQKPAIGKAYPDGLQADWRGISIEGDLSSVELDRSINSLRSLWRPADPEAKGNDRLDAMQTAARWQDLPNGRSNLAEMGAPDLGIQRDKPQQATYVKLDKRGRQVTALVFHIQSDNGGCYKGTLNDAGKMTNVQFYNPMQWDDEGIVKADDFWPDRLAPRPMRIGSPRVQALLSAPESGWNFDLCRKAFAAE